MNECAVSDTAILQDSPYLEGRNVSQRLRHQPSRQGGVPVRQRLVQLGQYPALGGFVIDSGLAGPRRVVHSNARSVGFGLP